MKTHGEYLVGTSFNPSKSGDVDEIKQAAAKLIDLIYEASVNPESEGARCRAIAITNIEQGAMWAVKAVTKPPRDE